MISSARKVIVNKDETTIIEGAGSLGTLKSRLAQINTQEKAKANMTKITKRAAALSSKVAVIKVGGATGN